MKLDLKLNRQSLVPDLSSGLTVALVSIPEGMAYALVAGVDPVYGLYTGMVTTIVAALTGSTSLMIVTLTNALALVAGDALAELDGSIDPITALFTLTFLVGIIMFLLGILRLGSVIRFVSMEVMSGFVFATALLIVLGQYDELVGYASTLEEANKLVKAIDITLNVGHWDLYTALLGVGSIMILLLMKRIRPIKKYADVLIIILAGLFVWIIGWTSVELVGDIANVPSGLSALPTPVLPDLSLLPVLMIPAIAAAVVGLAESSGVGAAYPNPDESSSNMSQDFTSQGLGNLIGSFFQAMPAGGSLSRTGINASGGAQSRWSGAFAGVLLAVVLVLFGNLTEYIPMTALAALLIVIGAEAMIKEGWRLREAWRVDKVATGAAIMTIIAAVFIDLVVAIIIGVFLSLLLYTIETVSQVRALRLIRRDDGRYEKAQIPEKLPSNEATVIMVQGNVFFASVYSYDDLVPDYRDTRNAVIISHMRGRETIDATTLEWYEKIVTKLKASGNLLMLSGIEKPVYDRLKQSEAFEMIGEENLFQSEKVIGASLDKALDAAEKWIAEQNK
ncbi:MAG TPA: SulP family inorganic anion transporter [candidate division Zixibacteria bacterium]|nr:SulP family inorganic anion transporter [candidate division Zixibacteria bacterium]